MLIDEMRNLDSVSLAAVCMGFQVVSRDALPVALVGAGLPDLQVRLMRAKPYADHLFECRELGRLADPAARVALVKLAVTLGVDFDEVAALESAPYTTAAVARACAAGNQRQTSPHRDSLIQKGLIWPPRWGQVDFTVPLFAEYLLEHHPIRGFDEA